jgi:hypothetical protein
MDQLFWRSGHVALFLRDGGVPLRNPIGSLKTGVAASAWPTAMVTRAFATFSSERGFAVGPRCYHHWVSGVGPGFGQKTVDDFQTCREQMRCRGPTSLMLATRAATQDLFHAPLAAADAR